jgi:hypothetical protein
VTPDAASCHPCRDARRFTVKYSPSSTSTGYKHFVPTINKHYSPQKYAGLPAEVLVGIPSAGLPSNHASQRLLVKRVTPS